MPDELLNELKKLRHPRGESSPFASKLEFMTWVDAVLPRLAALDIPLAARFKSAVAGALSGPGTGLAEVALINEAIGILNQAVLLLETKALQGRHSIFPAATIDAPTRLTLKQRCARTPFKFYLSLGGGLLVAFLAGFWTGVFVEDLRTRSTGRDASGDTLMAVPLANASKDAAASTGAKQALASPAKE